MKNIQRLKHVKHLPSIWLFGGSSKLGMAITNKLKNKYTVINLNRNIDEVNSNETRHLSIDLTDISKVKLTFTELIAENSPRGIIFCQRYRPLTNSNEFDVISGFNTEIISSQIIIEKLLSRKENENCSIIFISSVNGNLINKNLPFWYHWIKASQQILVKYYAVKSGPFKMNINCICAGSFLKDDIAEYPKYLMKNLQSLIKHNPMKDIANIRDIAALAEFLISDEATMINGQIITIDGGMTNILQESLI
jgi:3-oxoacyl-[acyl-carrier protein] reductase